MSGTTRSETATKPGSERSTEPDHSNSGRNGADPSKEAAYSAPEAVIEAVVTATEISSKVAKETGEALMIGARTVANAGGPVADISFAEMAAVQRDLFINAVDHAVRSSSSMLDIMSHAAQDAVRPLQHSRHWAVSNGGRSHVARAVWRG